MSDKRSVSTDALETLGTIINADQGRDAIHLAVEPIEAASFFNPGDHVAILDGKAVHAQGRKGLGIVDPFLTSPIQPGQRFWLVVYPRQITSLRHVWSHPDFAEDAPPASMPDMSESEAWIRDYVRRLNEEHGSEHDRIEFGVTELTYEELLEAIEDGYLSKGPMLEGVSIERDFFVHASVVTGKPVREDDLYFSCSC